MEREIKVAGITIGTLLFLGHTGFFLSATVSMLVRRAGNNLGPHALVTLEA